MKKFLILAIASCTAWLVQAQNPTSITLPKGPVNYSTAAPDVPCNNFAGTFTLGASGVNTQSNDLTLDTIWLCHNDVQGSLVMCYPFRIQRVCALSNRKMLSEWAICFLRADIFRERLNAG